MKELKYKDWIKEISRPSWDEYYLSMVEIVKLRSSDYDTKHGCILVDEKNRIVATGYNSFPSGFPDNIFPNSRKQTVEPDCPKYKWVLHSEENAVSNLTTKNYEKLTCYITGTPCTKCLKLMYQNGVRRIVMSNTYGWQFSSEEKTVYDETVYYGNIIVESLDYKYVVSINDNSNEYPNISGKWLKN